MKTNSDSRIAELDSFTTRLNNGYLRFFDAPKPANVKTPLAANSHVLAELRYSNPAFAGSVADVATDVVTATAAPITGGLGTAAAGNGTTTTFASAFAADGTTRVADFSVGLVGTLKPDGTPFDINLAAVIIVQNVLVRLDSQVITNPDGA